MPLQDFQHSVGGVVLGPGTPFTLSDVVGFGLGEKREKRYPIAGTHNTAWGREWRDGPTITFEGAIEYPGDPASTVVAMGLLIAGWESAVDQTVPKARATWTYKLPGISERATLGRPNLCRVATNQLVIGRAAFTLTFDVDGKITL